MRYLAINKNRYYIVDLTDLGKPELFHNVFIEPVEAEEVICEYLKYDFKTYNVIIGLDAIKHGLKFKMQKKGERALCKIIVTKYDYPGERVSQQNKKTYRTIQRRLKRKQTNR
jgi:hypothetical protein